MPPFTLFIFRTNAHFIVSLFNIVYALNEVWRAAMGGNSEISIKQISKRQTSAAG